MNPFKGTPGPWSYEGGNNENCEVQAKDTTIDLTRCDRNTGEHVISREEMEANARLIAAAPELLQVCLKFHQHISESLMAKSPFGLDEAINKALGKEQ